MATKHLATSLADDDAAPATPPEAVKKKRPEHPTPTQQLIIRALMESKDPLDRDALDKACAEVSASNMTTQLYWARQSGWIKSERHATDSRRAVYAATPEGIAALSNVKRTKFVALGSRKDRVVEIRVRASGMTVAQLDSAIEECGGEARAELARIVAARCTVDTVLDYERAGVELGIGTANARTFLRKHAAV